MRHETNKILLCVVIAIAMFAGVSAVAEKAAVQGDETLADPTAAGPKGTGFLHISITNLLQEQDQPYRLFGDLSATLRLRAKSDLAVFQVKVPSAVIGLGFNNVNDFMIRDLILDGFASADGRAGGIVADAFFAGEGRVATLKVLDEDVECGGAEADPNMVTVSGCPLGPNPGSAAEILKVADVTIAFDSP